LIGNIKTTFFAVTKEAKKNLGAEGVAMRKSGDSTQIRWSGWRILRFRMSLRKEIKDKKIDSKFRRRRDGQNPDFHRCHLWLKQL
jgi:hypothetical protein